MYLGEAISTCATLTSLKLSLISNSISYNSERILKEVVIKAKRLIKYAKWQLYWEIK